MTIRLRAHHLLCMLTYVGKGYSPGFTANYDRIAERLSLGEDILMVAGPDDICAPLLGERGAHCHRSSVALRDLRAARDLEEVLGHSARPGQVFSLDARVLARLRAGFKRGETRAACAGCEWSDLCDSVAGAGFGESRVRL